MVNLLRVRECGHGPSVTLMVIGAGITGPAAAGCISFCA